MSSVAQTSPHDLAAERAVLGAVLINPGALDTAVDVVQPSDFFRRGHQLVFDAMVATSAGAPVDAVTLCAELSRRGDLDEVGGPAYITQLTEGVPRSTHVRHYAGIVREKAALRRVIHGATVAIGHAHAGDLDASLRTIASVTTAAELVVDDEPQTLINDVDILSTPDTPPMVAGILAAGSIYGIVGPQGAGKTTVALSASMGIACGQPFLGHDIVTSGPSIYVALEGQPFLKARVRAVKQSYGLPLDQTAGLFIWPHRLDLLDGRSVQRFVGQARAVAPTNVIIDTWAMAFTGDENSSQDVGRGLRALQTIRGELGCAVGLVHHTNAGATRERGSTALKAGLDTMLMITVADDALRLTCEKQRDGEAFAEIPIRLTPVPDSGAQVVRLASEVLPSTTLTSAQQRALVRLREDFVNGASSAEWKATMTEMPERTFYRVQAELERRGYVAAERKGRHTFYRIATGITATLPNQLPQELP